MMVQTDLRGAGTRTGLWLFLSFGIIALPCLTANAEQTKTVFSPFTGKLDFITKIDTNTITPGSGVSISCVSGVCTISTSGSASSLETIFGTARSSPTATIKANSPFTGSVTGSTITLGVDYSSFTVLGPNPPAASIAAGSLGDNVLASSITASIVGSTLTVSQGASNTVGFYSVSPSPGAGNQSILWEADTVSVGTALGYLGYTTSAAGVPGGLSIFNNVKTETARFANSSGGVWIDDPGGLSIKNTPSTTNLAPANGLYVQTGIVASTMSLPSFYVTSTSASATGSSGFSVTGPGNTLIQGTISGSTYTVVWSSVTSTAGLCAVATSTNSTVQWAACGTGGGANPGGSVNQLQYQSNSTTFGGVSNSIVLSTAVIISTLSVLNNTTTSGNTNPGLVDIFSQSPHPVNLLTVGSSTNQRLLVVPNNNMVDMGTLGSISGTLAVGDVASTWPNRIYATGDNTQFIDVRTGSTMTFQTGTANGPGDVRFQPAGNVVETISNVSGVVIASSETVNGAGGSNITYGLKVGSMTGAGLSSCSGGTNAVTWNSGTNLFGCNSGFITGNQNITVSGDATGSGTTAITLTAAARQANVTTLAASSTTVTGNAEVDGWQTNAGSMTISGGGNNSYSLGVKYGVSAGSMTGAGLSNCGDATHAVSWNSSTNLFGCQAISATASPGGNNMQIQYNNAGSLGGASAEVTATSITVETTSGLWAKTGVTVSSGLYYNTQPIIIATTTLTSTMSVVLASCTARETTNVLITLTLPPAASYSGNDLTIYDVGTDSCSIKVVGNGSDLIESTGVIMLNAQGQHASLHSIGNIGPTGATGFWASGYGGIQYTPWSIFSTQDDVGLYSQATSSAVMKCPIYIPVPVAVTGFRIDRVTASGTNRASVALFDMNGKYEAGVSTATLVNSWNNLLLTNVYQASPGWHYLGVSMVNATMAIAGSNSVNDTKAFCTIGATPSHLDLSQVSLTAGTANNSTYPAIDLLINGGVQGF